MLDLGWSELLIIAAVALIVVGPKELPGLLRTIGQFMRAIRKQADEFRSQFDEAIKETEFEEVCKEFQELKSDVKSTLRGATVGIEDDFLNLDVTGRNTDREQGHVGANGVASNTSTGASPQQKLETETDTEWIDRHNNAILANEENAIIEHALTDKIKDTQDAADVCAMPASKDKLKIVHGAGKAGAAT